MTQPPQPPDGFEPYPTSDPTAGAPPAPPVPSGAPAGSPYGAGPYPAAPAGTPPYGSYGAIPQPGAAGGAPPSSAMAIWSLVLAILFFIPFAWIVSVVLAIVVLVRSRSGRAGGRGLAIAALVIDLITFLATAAIVVALVVVAANSTSIDDLDTGDCFNADGLTSNGDTVSNLEKVGCSKEHVGEVLATLDLTSSQADGYGDDRANDLCSEAVTTPPSADGLSLVGLTQSGDPDAGDKLACVAFRTDGDKVTGPLA